MAQYLGSYAYGDVIYHFINTRDDTGPISAFTDEAGTGDPVIKSLRAGQTTPVTVPVVLSKNVGGLSGLHLVTLDTSADAEYNPGSGTRSFTCYVSDGKAGTAVVTNEKLFTFNTGVWATLDSVADSVWDEDIVAAHTTSDTAGKMLSATSSDVYWAIVDLRRDTTTDEYTVLWMNKNAVVSSGSISAPKLQAVKRVDGTDLIAETALTQVGSTNYYKLDTSSSRLTPGEAAIAIATATIGGATRTWTVIVGRDVA